MEILAGFIVGILGSFHCIGMCGPIALALPGSNRQTMKFLLQKLLYNLGRVITYSLMGAILGLIGEKIKLFGFQQALSVILGISILFSIILPVKFKGNFVFSKVNRLIEKFVKPKFQKLFTDERSTSFLLIGILNGFLPCGLVYIALAGALATGSILSGVLFMAMFGFGTLPAMFAASVAGGFISINIRKKMTKMIPVFTLLFAFIFILRGMNLGIPYLSPKLKKAEKQEQVDTNVINKTQADTTEVDCCH